MEKKWIRKLLYLGNGVGLGVGVGVRYTKNQGIGVGVGVGCFEYRLHSPVFDTQLQNLRDWGKWGGEKQGHGCKFSDEKIKVYFQTKRGKDSAREGIIAKQTDRQHSI